MSHALTPEDFNGFFRAIHGYDPFPWQTMLLQKIAQGDWPDVIDLPTASGKTACIDAAIFALALQADRPAALRTAARRIWFVVDRRIVVDEAYSRGYGIARMLAYVVADPKRQKEMRKNEELAGAINRQSAADGAAISRVAESLQRIGGGWLPLAVARLRGGVPRDLAWSYNPAQPAVITSTVDQVGSRLLFRAYGIGKLSAPIHAGLTAHDSLIILDEAHCATPFMQTARWIRRYRGTNWASHPVATPFHVTVMSATPPRFEDGAAVVWPSAEERGKALDHQMLRERADASKIADLVSLKKGQGEDPMFKAVANAARRYVSEDGKRRVAIMVNRVATAGAIWHILRDTIGESADVVLLTGRMRPLDRDELVEKWSPFLRARDPESPKRPIALVTTQCLEVGADFSFDALVTECASLDALRQRFGRLDRLGNLINSPATIFVRETDAKGKAPDPIYGEAISKTWQWLSSNSCEGSKGLVGRIDMGINVLVPKLPSDMQPLLAPQPDAPVLLPAYLDLWCQTSRRPTPEPDVPIFLHGPKQGSPEAKVVWRADLSVDRDDWIDVVELCPPLSHEALSVPLYRLRDWLRGGELKSTAADADVDLGNEDETAQSGDGKKLRFLLWRGRDESLVSDDARAIRPEDTVIVPANYDWDDRLGQRPDGALDLAERAFARQHHRAILRIHPSVLAERISNPAVRMLLEEARADEPNPDAITEQLLLLGSANAELKEDDWFSQHAYALATDKRRRFASYPDRQGLVLTGADNLMDDRPALVSAADIVFDAETLLNSDNSCELRAHVEDVERLTRRYATHCLPGHLIDSFSMAARLHDHGKLDVRFQSCLAGGRPSRVPLAKSKGDFTTKQWERLRLLSGLPAGFRHELASMQIVERAGQLGNGILRDLLMHLVTSHHGHGRPFAPIIDDETPPEIAVDVENRHVIVTGDDRNRPSPHQVDSGVAERFWRLNRQYGWWGLAYLEAILRLADCHASRIGDAQ